MSAGSTLNRSPMGETLTITSKLDWALRASLFLLALSAPISIAATQTAWAFAILFWILRAFFVRPTLRKDGIDLAILAFIALTVVSSAFSYEPEVSLRKLVAVSLVTIVYLVSGYVRDVTTLRRIVVVVLIAGVLTVVMAALSAAWPFTSARSSTPLVRHRHTASPRGIAGSPGQTAMGENGDLRPKR